MELSGLFRLVRRVEMMSVRNVCVMGGLLVIIVAVMFGRLAVVLGRLFVMFGSLVVMLGEPVAVLHVYPRIVGSIIRPRKINQARCGIVTAC
jgi:hypothetical protein